jgi:short-subunit dehydrogenase
LSILITGASAGIGRKLALHYLNCGLPVAAVARRQAKLEELQQESRGSNGSLRIYAADVTDKHRMAEVVTAVEQELGPIDLAIANAGVTAQQVTAQLNLEVVEHLFSTNVMGVMYTLVPAMTAMMARGQGQLVAISSLAGILPIPRLGVYGACKTAINYQLEALYWHLKPHGITVTTICPGFIESEMTESQQVPSHWCMNTDRAVAQIVKAIAQKRRFYGFPFVSYHFLRILGLLPHRIQGKVVSYIEKNWFPAPSTSPTSPVKP